MLRARKVSELRKHPSTRILDLALYLPGGQIPVRTEMANMPLTCGYVIKWSYGDSNPRPLACHADPVRRSTSDTVEPGASCLQEQSEHVAVSRREAEHAGSRSWLPSPLRTRARATIATANEQYSLTAQASSSATATRPTMTSGSPHLAWVSAAATARAAQPAPLQRSVDVLGNVPHQHIRHAYIMLSKRGRRQAGRRSSISGTPTRPN
jgi:hypothetical protein